MYKDYNNGSKAYARKHVANFKNILVTLILLKFIEQGHRG